MLSTSIHNIIINAGKNVVNHHINFNKLKMLSAQNLNNKMFVKKLTHLYKPCYNIRRIIMSPAGKAGSFRADRLFDTSGRLHTK